MTSDPIEQRGTALTRPTSAKAWDLRSAWATGLRVSVSTDLFDHERIEGTVSAVAATDAHARIAGLQIPLDRVLAVHRPSRLGDSSFDPKQERWRGRTRTYEPQKERLWSP
jgi:hypothetical protein